MSQQNKKFPNFGTGKEEITTQVNPLMPLKLVFYYHNNRQKYLKADVKVNTLVAFPIALIFRNGMK